MKSEKRPMYRGYDIVIRNGNGSVWSHGKEIKAIKNHPTSDLKAILQEFVDNFINNNTEISKIKCKLYPKDNGDNGDNGDNDRNPPELGDNILRGLQQQSEPFKKHIIAELAKWEQPPTTLFPCVRFGITGIISEGKAGQPNYQIESGTDKKPYHHTHEPFDAIAFDDAHITQGLTLADLKTIWNMD